MSSFLSKIVLRQIRKLSVANILQYAHSYDFSIQPAEAKQIHQILQTTDFDPLSTSDHNYLFNELEQVTNASTAEKAKQLLNQMLEQHGFSKYLHK